LFLVHIAVATQGNLRRFIPIEISRGGSRKLPSQARDDAMMAGGQSREAERDG
jgi:hypothetical protein